MGNFVIALLIITGFLTGLDFALNDGVNVNQFMYSVQMFLAQLFGR